MTAVGLLLFSLLPSFLPRPCTSFSVRLRAHSSVVQPLYRTEMKRRRRKNRSLFPSFTLSSKTTTNSENQNKKNSVPFFIETPIFPIPNPCRIDIKNEKEDQIESRSGERERGRIEKPNENDETFFTRGSSLSSSLSSLSSLFRNRALPRATGKTTPGRCPAKQRCPARARRRPSGKTSAW